MAYIDSGKILKMKFVQTKLTALLKAADKSVSDVVYTFDPNSDEETVYIEFDSGNVEKVDVTGDSLAALAKEVIGGIF